MPNLAVPGLGVTGLFVTEIVVPPGPPGAPALVPVTLIVAGVGVTGGATPFGSPDLLELVRT